MLCGEIVEVARARKVRRLTKSVVELSARMYIRTMARAMAASRSFAECADHARLRREDDSRSDDDGCLHVSFAKNFTKLWHVFCEEKPRKNKNVLVLAVCIYVYLCVYRVVKVCGSRVLVFSYPSDVC